MYLTATDTEIRKPATNHKNGKNKKFTYLAEALNKVLAKSKLALMPHIQQKCHHGKGFIWSKTECQ